MKRYLPIAVAIIVPALYLVLYTPYGMDTTDFGYFYAYSWRILQGEIPYRDFYYIKPALPLYWHAFWQWPTPENIQVLAGKAGFVLSMLASSWLGSLSIARIFNLRAMDLPLSLLATCGFVFGAHSFPHMPWHTVDGVLFSSAAIYCAIRAFAVPSALFSTCAMLCKQSFLSVPLAALAILWFWQRKKTPAAVFILATIAILAAVYIYLYSVGALAPMRAMTTGQLDLREALDAGLLIYLRQNFWLPFFACIPWIIAQAGKKQLPGPLYPAYCYLVLLAGWYIFQVWTKKTWIGFGASWPTLFMLLGLVEILFPKYFLGGIIHHSSLPRPFLRASIGFGSLLAAAWCVAISGGYKIPAFFAAPLVFAFFTCHHRMGKKVPPLAWTCLVAGLAMFWTGYQYPYTFPARPLARSEMTLDAGAIYPKASHVLIDRDMYDRLAELKVLREKYGPNYKTLPGFSFAYYLNNDKPVLGSDWLIDWEINGKVDELYKDLLDRKITVFMERDQLDAKKADAYERAGYGVPQMVRNNWRIVEETPHFVVFQPPLAK